jgi:WD40 repeat protein
MGSLPQLLLAGLLAAMVAGGLRQELRRLDVDTALVLPTPALDDYPIWSPDSRYVAGNVMGTWTQVDLQRISLRAATWRGGERLGVIENRAAVTPLDPALLKQWTPRVEPSPDVAERGPIRVEFSRNELSTALVVTRDGKPPRIVWSSGVETCGAPCISPDGHMVAFICEANGLLVMALDSVR